MWSYRNINALKHITGIQYTDLNNTDKLNKIKNRLDRNVGTSRGNLVEVQSNGKIHQSLIPTNITSVPSFEEYGTDERRFYFVSQDVGDDNNSGRNQNTPFATIGKATQMINNVSDDMHNTIVVLDGAEYEEDINLDHMTNLSAPYASIIGSMKVGIYCSAELYEHVLPDGNNVIMNGSNCSYEVNKISYIGDNGNYFTIGEDAFENVRIKFNTLETSDFVDTTVLEFEDDTNVSHVSVIGDYLKVNNKINPVFDIDTNKDITVALNINYASGRDYDSQSTDDPNDNTSNFIRMKGNAKVVYNGSFVNFVNLWEVQPESNFTFNVSEIGDQQNNTNRVAKSYGKKIPHVRSIKNSNNDNNVITHRDVGNIINVQFDNDAVVKC